MTSDEGEGLCEVRLVRFPLRVYARATEHYQELFREFALLAASTPEDSDEVPARLMRLIDALGRRYPPQTEHEAERAAALERGELSGDFAIKVPPSAAEASQALEDLLDEADDFCRRGDLLTLAAPAEAADFRRWYLREVIRQIAGDPPTPWPGGLH